MIASFPSGAAARSPESPPSLVSALVYVVTSNSLPKKKKAETVITPHITCAPLISSRRDSDSSTVLTLCTFNAIPAQALRMHSAMRSRHSLAIHFTTSAGNDVEAFDPIIELEQVKHEMARADPQDSEAESRKVDGKEG
jgi:hypothetical protein